MKKKVFIFTSIILFSITMVAQEIDSKIRVGVNASIAKNLGEDPIIFNQFEGLIAEYDKTNYSVGVQLEYLFSNNLTGTIGVNYANKDFTATVYCDVCDFAFPPTPMLAELRLVEIPVTARYYFLPNTLRVFGEAGINNHIFLDEAISVNTYSLSVLVGGGVEYKILPNTALQATVNYGNGVTKFFKQSDSKLKSVAFGVGLLRSI